MATTYNLSNYIERYTSSYGFNAQCQIFEYSPIVWNYLSNLIGNDYGVAGLVGNLYHESRLVPFIIQNDVPPSQKSVAYSQKVTSGAIDKDQFVKDLGYGLAQWTSKNRKIGYYDTWKNGGYDSIGNTDLALAYLTFELNNSYISTLNILKSASNIRQASDYVLKYFEGPADQSEPVQIERASYGELFYNLYAGGAPQPPTPPPSTDDSVTVNPNTITTMLGSIFTISANVVTLKQNTSIIWTHSDNINVVSELGTIFNGVMNSGFNGWVTANLVDENNNFLYSDSCTINLQGTSTPTSKWFLYQRNLFYKLFS